MDIFEEKLNSILNGYNFEYETNMPEACKEIEGLDKLIVGADPDWLYKMFVEHNQNIDKMDLQNISNSNMREFYTKLKNKSFVERVKDDLKQSLERSYIELSPWSWHIKEYDSRVRNAFFEYYHERYPFFEVTDNMKKWRDLDERNIFEKCGKYSIAVICYKNILYIDVSSKVGSGELKINKDGYKYYSVVNQAKKFLLEKNGSSVDTYDFEFTFIPKYVEEIHYDEMIIPTVLCMMAAMYDVDINGTAIIGRFNKLGDFKFYDISRCTLDATLRSGCHVVFIYGTPRFYDMEMMEVYEKKGLDSIYVTDYMEIWDLFAKWRQ